MYSNPYESFCTVIIYWEGEAVFRILVAELLIDIEPRYALIGEWCSDYMVYREEWTEPDITIHISDQEMQREMKACPYFHKEPFH